MSNGKSVQSPCNSVQDKAQFMARSHRPSLGASPLLPSAGVVRACGTVVPSRTNARSDGSQGSAGEQEVSDEGRR
jgi:hypothetical protein